MSITGSLVGYENNNDLCNKKNRSLLNVTGSSKQCASLNSSISNSVITTASSSVSASKSNHQNCNNESMQHKKQKHRFHLNTLWSMWYGILGTYFQGYLILHGAHRFLGCYLIQWRVDPPVSDLNLQILLCGFASLLLPLFFISTIFKVGNLANDGIKLANGSGKCSAEPEDGLEEEAKGGTLRAIWTHGGPTSAFIHIVMALCLLLPRLLLESKLIENGNLSRENIWRTDLDFMVTHRDRLVILSFMTSPYQNISNDDQNDTKVDRPPYFEDDLSHTHLIEKFHSGSFDENDYFETHEKLEIETAPMTTATTTTAIISNGVHKTNTILSTSNQSSGDAVNVESNGNKKHHARTKNRNNSGGQHGKNNGGGRKHSSRNEYGQHRQLSTTKDTFDVIERPTDNKKDKNNRRGDDNIDEKLEIKLNKKYDFNKINNEFDEQTSTVFNAVTKFPKQKYKTNKEARIVDIVDELPSEQTIETSSAGRKSSTKNSHIHVVKAVEGIVPSTPISTDSKIIEIKPSTNRIAKKIKRSADFVENDSNDDDTPPPRIYVNVRNNEQLNSDNIDNEYLEPSSAAALIGAIPVNVTISTAVHLPGFAGCLQKYLNVNKEIDLKSWSSVPSWEFINLVLALAIWSSRYPSVFWSTSKPFAAIFSIQMIANSIDILLSFAGVSVLYKLQVVGQQLPLQTPPLLLNGIVSLLLYILSILLITSSSLILYLYGHGRLSSRMRDRRMISTKTGDTWAYFAHCASLCFILALAVVKAPLMHDFSAIYRGSLDGAVLAGALSSVMHIFFWILLWLCLTAKRRWNFKLPPMECHPIMSAATEPLLLSPRPHRHNSHNMSPHIENPEETIYWPKLTPSSPKLKVTFNDVPSTLSDNNLAEHDGKR